MKLRSAKIALPHVYPQAKDFTCGVAVVRTVLHACGLPVPSERRLIPILRATNRSGTKPAAIVRYLQSLPRRWGLRARIHTRGSIRDLLHTLKAGRYPIVDWSDWGGHYGLVTAIDLADTRYLGGVMVIADSAAEDEHRHGWTLTSVERFKAMWYDRIPPATKGLWIEVVLDT
jgi:hypothetical protein